MLSAEDTLILGHSDAVFLLCFEVLFLILQHGGEIVPSVQYSRVIGAEGPLFESEQITILLLGLCQFTVLAQVGGLICPFGDSQAVDGFLKQQETADAGDDDKAERVGDDDTAENLPRFRKVWNAETARRCLRAGIGVVLGLGHGGGDVTGAQLAPAGEPRDYFGSAS